MTAISLAKSLLEAGNVAGAQQILRDSAAPCSERDLLLGRCALRLGDLAAAMAAFAAVLARHPGDVEAVVSLGALYVKQGWLDKAEALYSKFLKKADDDAVRIELAAVLLRKNKPDRGLLELGRVIQRRPDNFSARLQRALMFSTLGREEEAALDLRALVQEFPERNEAWGLLGRAEFACGRSDEALPYLREACRRQPRDGSAWYHMCLSLIMVGEMEEAQSTLAHLRQLDPARWRQLLDSTRSSRTAEGRDEIDPRPVFLLFGYQEQQLCNWTHRARYEQVFRSLVAHPGVCNPVPIAHFAGIVPLGIEERRQLMMHAGRVAATGIEPFPHELSPVPDRLRVGYVIPHLGKHVVANILRNLLAAHDPAMVEIHVIAVSQTEADRTSSVPQHYAALPGVTCLDLSAADDVEAATRLRDMNLDVLVDLGVYNDGARPGILARRPAPVQVSFLGAPFTSGADWMDYIITDPVVSPEVPGWCTEAEARMPGSYFTYGHEDAVPPAVPPRARFGLPEGTFLYSALNNPYKIDPVDFACWMRILAATPGSVLLFKDDKTVAANLRAEAVLLGMDPARLLFLPRVSDQDYLLRQGVPDLFLDARQYGAHTTMAESLWMGVPALSCRGEAFQGRVGASLLASCGLDELIMPDHATYEAMAIALFRDRERLQRLKAHLLQSRLQAAPFDMPGQARHLEKAFRHMRERFAAGLPPVSFNIGELPGQPGRST